MSINLKVLTDDLNEVINDTNGHLNSGDPAHVKQVRHTNILAKSLLAILLLSQPNKTKPKTPSIKTK